MFDPFRKLVGAETTVEKREREARERQEREARERERQERQERERREQAQRAGVNPDAVSTLSEHRGGVYALAVLPNGDLASGSQDSTIEVWSVERERCVSTPMGHRYGVCALAVLPNGDLASGSDDKTIKLWDVGLRALNLQEASDRAAALPVKKRDGEAARAIGKVTSMDQTPIQKESNTNPAVKASSLPSEAERKVLAEQQERERLLAAEVEALRARLAAVQQTVGLSALPLIKQGGEGSQKSETLAVNSDQGKNRKESFILPSIKGSDKTAAGSISQESRDAFDMGGFGSDLESLFIPASDVILGRELGRGGFGIVYEGTYARSETVAVKKYYGTKMPEKELRDMQHEIQMMKQLQSRFLVRLLGLVVEENSPAMLVMEHGANGSLYNYLHSHQAITWSLRLRIAEELARGLTYLHHKRIIHRDIKSLNIVLDQEFHAKWCDFGLAVLKLHTTTTTKQEGGGAVGTVYWMAPELLVDDHPIFGTSSDIWALGMVFFELASRERPYKDLREQQAMFKIAQGKSETVPAECQQQAPAFGALMQRCWAERTARPTAADIVEAMTQINRSFVETPVSTFGTSAGPVVDSGYMPFSSPIT